MTSAHVALERLRAGNARFVASQQTNQQHPTDRDRAELAFRQQPFAVILGCSDSRVPVELIFDQGLGDLFVIRVAGNVIGPAIIGSVEFAAAQLETRLVVVMGHSQCGAVAATLDELQKNSDDLSPSLQSTVDRIRPSVEGLLESNIHSRDVLLDKAVKANVRASAQQLRVGSEILEERMDTGGLRVVGARYSLLTGLVEFFDGIPLD